jgi:hypothetical protein
LSTKRIHVNRQRIDSNRKHGKNDPVITVKRGRKNFYGDRVDILGPSMMVYAEKCGMKNLSCGARVYIQTESDVLIDGEKI